MAISNTSSATSTSSSTNTSVTGSQTAIAGNFDQFLTLLTTQLQNQNPLDPLDTNQFTQQLVQFAGVEQQLKTNDTLNTLLLLNKVTTATNAVDFVGTTITADGATTELKDGTASWHINAARGGSSIITIKDANGAVVQTANKTLTAGDQTYTWDGTTSTGTLASAGQYTITVDAKDVSGQTITTKTEVTGVVDGVDFRGTAPVLQVGGLSIPIETLKSVVR